MRYLFTLLVVSALISCDSSSEKKTSTSTTTNTNTAQTKDRPDFDVATTFINDYVRYLSGQFNGGTDTLETDWVMQHSLLTQHFKTSYKNLLDSAQKIDPELGLDFDPILDAQDFPDNGFMIAKKDTVNNYVFLSAKGYKGFDITMKLTRENNKWLVDGCGVINIPEEKRAVR